MSNSTSTFEKTIYNAIIILLVGSLISFLLTSCKKDYGSEITKTLEFSKFEKVRIDNAANVTIVYGTTQKVEVTGDEFIINKKLKNTVANNELELDLINGVYQNYNLHYTITMPKIIAAEVDGSGSFTIGDFDQTEALNFGIDGSGNINFGKFQNIEVLTAHIDGSGSIIAKEVIDPLSNLNIEIDGSGSAKFYNVKASTATVVIDGSGSIYVTSNTTLNATISGSGNINYKGYPTTTNLNLTGSGSLTDRN